MDLLATSGAPLLLVNLVFAAIALAIGFAAGAWVTGAKNSASTNTAEDPRATAAEALEQQLSAEQTVLASDRLRDLAASVASDVGTHNASIGEIEARLSSSNSSGNASPDAVLDAIDEIGKANNALQNRLAKAEEQIQSQAQLIRTHESEARTDSLTSLANRRAFDDEMNRRFAEWERNSTEFSLLILDVDHFKKFNDTHGHQAGDEVLRQVGKAITQCARDMDLACRYGGEEFAIIMPATEASSGCVLAERVRNEIEAMEVQFEGKTLRVTTSLGLAGLVPGDQSTTIIKRADEALYTSKDAGRNNTHLHTGTECVPVTAGRTTCQSTALGLPAADAAITTVLDALPNRTRFLETLRTEVRVSQDTNVPLSVLTADFEGYDRLESEFGEAIARLTLDSIAQFLDNAIQEHDSLCRLDGGRFVVLMPRQTGEGAGKLGNRINAALAKCAIPLGETQLHLGTAMSATELTAEDTPASFMERAESKFQEAELCV